MHREAMASPDNPALGQRPDSAETAPDQTPPPHAVSSPPPATPAPSARRRWLLGGVGVLALLLILFEGIPWVRTALQTVSTDDAYVNGHVTFVAARVPGQVARVLVDDNNRVRKGDLLVAARQGAVPGAGQHRPGGGRCGAGRSASPPRPRRAGSRVRRAACASTWSMRSRTWTTRSRCCAREVATLESAEGDAGAGAGRLRPRRDAAGQVGEHATAEEFDHRKEALRVARGAGRRGAAGRLPDSRRAGPAAGAATRRRPGARCRPIWIRPSPRCGRPRRS